MKDDQAYYLMLGVEIQAETHYALPVRNMLYDAMSYAQQVSDIGVEHRKNKDKMVSGDMMTAIRMRKEDRPSNAIRAVTGLSDQHLTELRSML